MLPVEEVIAIGLTPSDFVLLDHVTDNVPVNKAMSIQDLKCGICEAIEGIQQLLCDLVMENFIKRIRPCKSSRDGLFTDIVFHYWHTFLFTLE